MQHLTPVGLSEDGDNLVLVSDAGEEYVVRIDSRFRTALRGDNARLGQLEMKMESALRPRDIQARIRSGESAEDVAAAAQTTVDAIMAFAGPVLAERAHVAQTALKASIRRRTNETTPGARTLDDASRLYLTAIGVRADDVSWDAWRRDDGRWSLTATYAQRGTEHRATFTYDQPGRYVLAEDDEARLLTGEASPAGEPAGAPTRHLSALSSGEDELPLGDDAIELVRGPQPVEEARDEQSTFIEPVETPAAGPQHDTTDLTGTAAAVREAAVPAEQTAFDDLAADHADADWIAELPLDVPAEDGRSGSGTSDEVEAVADEPSEAEPPPPEESGTADSKPRKKGRSSVPSWDEIMFGGGGRD